MAACWEISPADAPIRVTRRSQRVRSGGLLASKPRYKLTHTGAAASLSIDRSSGRRQWLSAAVNTLEPSVRCRPNGQPTNWLLTVFFSCRVDDLCSNFVSALASLSMTLQHALPFARLLIFQELQLLQNSF